MHLTSDAIQSVLASLWLLIWGELHHSVDIQQNINIRKKRTVHTMRSGLVISWIHNTVTQ
jgi:hypothetical protein